MHLRTAKYTETGLRDQNEDAVLALPELVVVSDGMGGHAAGEIASKIAIETVPAELAKNPTPEGFAEAVQQANRAVYNYGRTHPEARGLGCTLTAGMTTKKGLYVAHVGDSRCTLIEDGEIKAVTTDHTHVEDLVKKGEITREKARGHPYGSILTRSIGSNFSVVIDLVRIPLRPGQIFLFTTDGVHDALTDDQVLQIVESERRASKIAPALVAAALAAGSQDNVTCAVLTVHR